MLLPTMHVSPDQTAPAYLLQLWEDILCLLPVSCHDGGLWDVCTKAPESEHALHFGEQEIPYHTC